MSVDTPLVDEDGLAASAESVEPLPHTVARLATLVADPETEIREIAEVVSLDISLTADLLRRANSAALGGRTTITSARDAAIRLGRSMLLSLALASSVGRRMAFALPPYGLQAGELWERSVAASIAADAIRSRAGTPIPAEASTAALLHDFGKVVLSRHFGNRILDMVDLAAANDGLDLLEAERVVFGRTHAEIGGAVAERWGLPMTIVDGITDHHEAHDGMSAVSAAVSLACTMSFEIARPEPTPEAQSAAVVGMPPGRPLFDVLRLDHRAYNEIVEQSRKRFAEVSEQYAG